jgi:hypothetical protein
MGASAVVLITAGKAAAYTSRRRAAAAVGLAVLAGAIAWAPAARASSDVTAVSLGGDPMTVYIGPRGECQSSYTINGLVEGNLFPGGDPYVFRAIGDCGFFLAFPKGGSGQPPLLEGKTFGFEGNAPAVDFSSIYEPIDQSPVSGDGSAGNPYVQSTTFAVVDSGHKEAARVTETTSYTSGAPQFTSTYAVKNTSSGKLYFRAIYAADLFVNGDDHGVGVFLDGSPRFIGGMNTASGILGGLQEPSPPALPWSSYEELAYPGIWQRIKASDEETEIFKDSYEANEVDNAVGVAWDQFRQTGLDSGAERSFSIVNRTQVPSSLVVQPATQTQTVGRTATVTITAADTGGVPYVNRPVVYSIGATNPKSGSVTTNAAGVATISYVGTAVGVDTMRMFLDLPGTGIQSARDPAATATVTWTPAGPTADSSYTIKSIKANPNGTITIVFVPKQDGKATLGVTVPTATISHNASIAKRKRCKRNQIRIKGKCRPKTSLSGKVSATGKAGVPLTLTVKASGKVKRALAKGRKVRLTAKLSYKSALGGTPTVRAYHVSVKGKRSRRTDALQKAG